MISQSERDLAAYLDIRDLKVNGRYLANRVFRGTIRQVIQPVVSGLPGITAGPFYVTVNRIEDQTTGVVDLTRYACSVPGYAPCVGDVVDLFFRNADEAYVLQPVTYKPYRARAWANTSFAINNNTAVRVACDTLSYDPTGSMDITVNKGRFTCLLAGYYLVLASATLDGTYVNGFVTIRQNGNDSSRGAQATLQTSPAGDILRCAAGDFIEAWVFQQSGANHSSFGGGGGVFNYLAVQYIGP